MKGSQQHTKLVDEQAKPNCILQSLITDIIYMANEV